MRILQPSIQIAEGIPKPCEAAIRAAIHVMVESTQISLLAVGALCGEREGEIELRCKTNEGQFPRYYKRLVGYSMIAV